MYCIRTCTYDGQGGSAGQPGKMHTAPQARSPALTAGLNDVSTKLRPDGAACANSRSQMLTEELTARRPVNRVLNCTPHKSSDTTLAVLHQTSSLQCAELSESNCDAAPCRQNRSWSHSACGTHCSARSPGFESRGSISQQAVLQVHELLTRDVERTRPPVSQDSLQTAEARRQHTLVSLQQRG
jgi:hypothetical protein